MSQPEPLTEQQLDEIDTLPAWLYQRFMAGGVDWENLDDGDRAYWEHQARAVRRAVARGGFKTASEATSAPLAASQPPEAPVEGETATRASMGRTGDPRRTLTPNEYDAARPTAIEEQQ